MDGEVDTAGGEGFFDLLDEDAGAVGRQTVGRDEGRVLHAVAGGADDFDGNGVAVLAELRGDVVGLPERELRAARADADGLGVHLSRIRGLKRASVDGFFVWINFAQRGELRVQQLGGEGFCQRVDRGLLRGCKGGVEVGEARGGAG